MSSFDPKKSFFELSIVKFIVSTILIFSFISWLTICLNSKLDFDFSYEGFNFAIYIFKVPLGLLTLIIPVIAILVANHRSEQTKEQLELLSRQNNFSNYYKHVEEFKNFIPKSDSFSVVSIFEFHENIFPGARQSDFLVSSSLVKNFDDLIDDFMENGKSIVSGKIASWGCYALSIQDGLYGFCKKNSIAINRRAGYETKVDGKKLIIPNRDLKDFVLQFLLLSHFIDQVFRFDSCYRSSEKMQKILSVEHDSIESCKLSENDDIGNFCFLN